MGLATVGSGVWLVSFGAVGGWAETPSPIGCSRKMRPGGAAPFEAEFPEKPLDRHLVRRAWSWTRPGQQGQT